MLRASASQLISRIPDFRGRNRLAYVANRLLLNSSAGSTAEVAMRLGHRMIVDLRAHSEYASFYTHDYDTEEIRSVLRMFTPEWVVLDVGANVGFWTIPMAKALGPGGKVHAFEPVASNNLRLRENARLNGMERTLVVHELGLSDRRASLRISLREDFANGSGTGNASIVIDDSDGRFQCGVVEVETLDNIFPSLNMKRLDFIKVDIEGHEDKFLSGAASTIGQFRPILHMEINEPYYSRRGLDATTVFGEWAASANYGYALRTTKGWRLRDVGQRKPVIDNVLALPAERASQVLQQMEAR
ncbi:MAG: FkbM family methyltransferase [Candidatus Korobacteraceae bacterium]